MESITSDLVVIGFNNEHIAFEMRAELVKLQKEYLIEMEDVVVVTKDDKDKVKLYQAMNLTAAGVESTGMTKSIPPLPAQIPTVGSSTDVDDTSWITPTMGIFMPTMPENIGVHTRMATSTHGMSIGVKGEEKHGWTAGHVCF